jgi:hypothetical protein
MHTYAYDESYKLWMDSMYWTEPHTQRYAYMHASGQICKWQTDSGLEKLRHRKDKTTNIHWTDIERTDIKKWQTVRAGYETTTTGRFFLCACVWSAHVVLFIIYYIIHCVCIHCAYIVYVYILHYTLCMWFCPIYTYIHMCVFAYIYSYIGRYEIWWPKHRMDRLGYKYTELDEDGTGQERFAYTYVCVCMSVCVYVCMYVCMYAHIHSGKRQETSMYACM